MSSAIAKLLMSSGVVIGLASAFVWLLLGLGLRDRVAAWMAWMLVGGGCLCVLSALPQAAILLMQFAGVGGGAGYGHLSELWIMSSLFGFLGQACVLIAIGGVVVCIRRAYEDGVFIWTPVNDRGTR